MSTDLDRLTTYLRDHLPREWAAYPGGWPNQAEAALLDAVLSIRARYGRPTNGVRGAIGRWRAHRGVDQLDDLRVLASLDGDELSEILGNSQVLSGGQSKGAAVAEAAGRLVAAGVVAANDLDPNERLHRRAYVGVRGLGDVTWAYFCMLLGHSDVKADTWVVRVVSQALGRSVSSAEARQLLVGAAGLLNVKATVLDHAVWDFARRGGLLSET